MNTGASLIAVALSFIQLKSSIKFAKEQQKLLQKADECANIGLVVDENIDVPTAIHSDICNLENTENFNSNALNHIFNGDVSKNGSITGFHYEKMSTKITSIIPGTKTTLDKHGVYEARVVGKKYRSSFFPKSMTPQQIVDSINQAYASRVSIKGNTYNGITSSGMTISMFLDENDKITSAFPIYTPTNP